jgi:hypothetical protein
MSPYPLRLEGHLDEPLSRWLWLVKWLLAIPHFVVLFFLYVGAFFVWVISLFAILFTGRFPRGLFDYQLGVMRWTWRVAFYTFSALGTDRYPPFSLDDHPDYPARLDVDYPDHLSRGLVLVKWWLLAIPQLLIITVLAGGGYGIGLIGLLVFFAAVALLFTGRYPRSMFDFIMGLNRWYFRVNLYIALMTDQYPPFRLDQGEDEPLPGGTAPTGVTPAPV